VDLYAIEQHQVAMAAAMQADLHRLNGDREGERRSLIRAWWAERHAAEVYRHRTDMPSTRAVLYRSAATLALQAGEPHHAVTLAQRGLEHDGPAEIRAEIEDVRRRAAAAVHRILNPPSLVNRVLCWLGAHRWVLRWLADGAWEMDCARDCGAQRRGEPP
jgi:hypothetical protein